MATQSLKDEVAQLAAAVGTLQKFVDQGQTNSTVQLYVASGITSILLAANRVILASNKLPGNLPLKI